jgi:proteasome lid subunit RPN8/RPN11
MSEIDYQYAIEYLSQDGERLGSVPVEPDWGPARECAQFLAIRKGIIPPVFRDGTGSIEPVWDSECGAPFLSAARVVVAAEAGDETVSEEVPSVPYFLRLAQAGSAAMIERGLLERGEVYRYKVCAYPSAAPGAGPRESEAGAFSVEEIFESLPLEARPIEPFLASATAWGSDSDPSDMRVFIPQHVMDAVVAKSREVGEVETGGMLVGKLHRCASSPEIFLEVTAQIPAAHTEPQAARLTFTVDSWAAVQAAIELRDRDELMCGWWHFHPDFCRKCPEERRRGCVLSRPFFSLEDIHMHRTIFPRAFHIALLVSDHGRESLDVSLFGWRHGMVVSRGCDVLGAAGSAAKAAS